MRLLVSGAEYGFLPTGQPVSKQPQAVYEVVGVGSGGTAFCLQASLFMRFLYREWGTAFCLQVASMACFKAAAGCFRVSGAGSRNGCMAFCLIGAGALASVRILLEQSENV
jgi:hypothetical protein